MSKPLELWLKRWKDDKFNFQQTEFCKVDPKTLYGVDCEDFTNPIHMIEKSAYDKILKQNEEMKELMEVLVGALDSCAWVDNDRGAVTGVARKAIRAYSKIKENNNKN